MKDPSEFKDYQILGANVQVILDGFGSFTLLASKILLELGLGKVDSEGIGMATLTPTEWYPLDAFLKAFQRIGAEFGDFTLRQAGIHINKVAVVPPDFFQKGIINAFAVVDFPYHMNHAHNGKPMFDPATGQMAEGIGHFASKPLEGKKQLLCVVDTPYPCAFDEGIVVGMAQRFDPQAKVTHDPKSCRKRGADSCTYSVSWK
jgi:hypothetical protein